MIPSLGIALFLILILLANSVRILREYERGVVFRLGRYVGTRGPGLILLVPMIERMQKVSLRTIAMDIPPQDVITRDNVSVTVNAVLYFRVIDPQRSVLEVEDYLFATGQIAQTTLRSTVGQAELDELLSERDKINAHMQTVIDEQTDPWGIKVMLVEVKDVDLPLEMKRAMARQAEAERERRSKVILAEGEFQASQRLSEAAAVIELHPVALQLRYLQALQDIAAENNSTTVFPIPIDLFEPFRRRVAGGPDSPSLRSSEEKA